jgi:hypothetical protein
MEINFVYSIWFLVNLLLFRVKIINLKMNFKVKMISINNNNNNKKLIVKILKSLYKIFVSLAQFFLFQLHHLIKQNYQNM